MADTMAVLSAPERAVLPPPGAPALPGCTPGSVRCPSATDYHAVLPACCRAHLVQMSRDVAQAFALAGVMFWVDYGTLLGAVRNPRTTWADYPWLPAGEGAIPPGIIPHDKDADWGVLRSDFDRAHRALRWLRGLRGYDLIARRDVGRFKLRRSRHNHTNLDLFGWAATEDGRYTRSQWADVDAWKGRVIPADLLFPLSTVEWEGLTLPAPRDPEAFLAFRYGPQWQTPIPANHDGVVRADDGSPA